jgi:hypothetical protein
MVVPLGDHGHVGIHRADVGVQHVVSVASTELVQGLGHLVNAVRDEVAPDLAILFGDAFRDGSVGVDGVAGVDEEIRLGGMHGCIAAHSADLLIDAPALARCISGPDEALASTTGGTSRSRAGTATPTAGCCTECALPGFTEVSVTAFEVKSQIETGTRG